LIDSGNNPTRRCIEHRFANRPMLADALAAAVADDLRAAIQARGRALLAVSGGSTPQAFLRALSSRPLDWSRVTVTLCDERWVSPDNERSNARLVREALLQDAASAARFVALYVDTPDPESGAAQIAAHIAMLPLPLDVAVLGLGLDGHTASLFPDGDRIEAALAMNGSDPVMPMRAASAGEPRITLTAPVLAAARALYLHIEGPEKKQVFEQIVRDDSAPVYSPLRVLMQHSSAPLAVYWCE
jgi:6-phosphogluconolactonase